MPRCTHTHLVLYKEPLAPDRAAAPRCTGCPWWEPKSGGGSPPPARACESGSLTPDRKPETCGGMTRRYGTSADELRCGGIVVPLVQTDNRSNTAQPTNIAASGSIGRPELPPPPPPSIKIPHTQLELGFALPSATKLISGHTCMQHPFAFLPFQLAPI